MVVKKVSFELFPRFIEYIRSRFERAYGPTKNRRGIIAYGQITNNDDLLWENPKYSPKNIFLPHGESIVEIANLEFKPVQPDETKFAIFITPADLNGLYVLDCLFLDRKLPDPYYGAKRKNAFYICIKVPPNPNMFNIETGLNMSEVKGYDLYIVKR
ncbi:MAG: hypothetical protein ACTSU2_12760, partial [Promethearchaeota archaeon]